VKSRKKPKPTNEGQMVSLIKQYFTWSQVQDTLGVRRSVKQYE
jgi:hypothetical protein